MKVTPRISNHHSHLRLITGGKGLQSTSCLREDEATQLLGHWTQARERLTIVRLVSLVVSGSRLETSASPAPCRLPALATHGSRRRRKMPSRFDPLGAVTVTEDARMNVTVERGEPLKPPATAKSPVIDAGRLQRAIWLEVQPVARGRFLVRGGRDDHLVDVDGGYVHCDCVAYTLRGDSCKHCLCVRLTSGDRQVVRALRQLVPNPKYFPAKRRQGAA